MANPPEPASEAGPSKTRVTFHAIGACGDEARGASAETAVYHAEYLFSRGNFRMPIYRIVKRTLTEEDVSASTPHAAILAAGDEQ